MPNASSASNTGSVTTDRRESAASLWTVTSVARPRSLLGRHSSMGARPDGQKTLRSQRMLDVIAPVADHPASKIVGTLPPQRLTIDGATRASLANLERAAFS